MNKIKLKFMILAASSLTVVAMPALVYADHGSGGGDSNTTTSTTTDGTGGGDSTATTTNDSSTSDSHSGSGSNVTENKTGNDSTELTVQEHETEQSDSTKAEDEGKALVDNLLKTESKHSDQERAKNCQAASQGLTTKMTNLQKNAASFEAKIDSTYQQALDFQKANNLNPAGIAQLEAAANTDEAAAKAAVAALSSLSVNLDCSSASVARNVATFKAAAAMASSSLTAYKHAVVSVLTALGGSNQ